MSAPPLRATDPRLAAEHDERVAKHPRHVVWGPGVPGLPADVCKVKGRKRGAGVYHVLLGTHRRTFLYDTDATRCIVERTWNDTATAPPTEVTVEFPVQRGSVLAGPPSGPGAARPAWALTPVGCSCPDWLYRGTDSQKAGAESVRSATRSRRRTAGGGAGRDRVMGALRGCKHMIAVKARLAPASVARGAAGTAW